MAANEALENELADFAHQREPYDTHWMDDRIKVFLARNLVIPRSEIPIVGEDEHGGVNAPKEYHQQISDLEGHQRYSAPHSKRYWLMGLLDIARAEHAEKEKVAIAQRKETDALERRRDELAAEFTAVNSYNGQLPYTQKLIDRIVELEGVGK